MRKTLPTILLALALPFAMTSTAQAAPPGKMAQLKGQIATQLSNQGPSGLLGRDCAKLNGIPVWGGLRANNPKVPSSVTATGVEATCEGGKVTKVVITRQYPGKLPKGTAWSMKWKEVYKTLKKAGLKDRLVKDKKSPNGPYVKLRSKGSGASVVWRWSDRKGKTPCDRITFAKS